MVAAGGVVKGTALMVLRLAVPARVAIGAVTCMTYWWLSNAPGH